ncbi:MAG: hypothetical protein ACO25Q_06920 [Sediminibacterium sp.]
MTLKYADNVGTQLFDPLTDTSTFAVIESVLSFPSGINTTDYAVATIANDDNSISEQIKITNIDRPTKTLTIERGMYGSIARDWPKGSKIEIRLSAGFMTAFEDQINNRTDVALAAAANTNSDKSKAAFAVAFVLS